MTGLLFKIALTLSIAMGLKEISRRFGPRVGGLILGFPTMTSLLTAFSLQHATAQQAASSLEGGLTGVIAASSFAVTFAIMVQRFTRLRAALANSLPVYAMVLLVMSLASSYHFYVKATIVVLGLFVLSEVAGRLLCDRADKSVSPKPIRFDMVFRLSCPAMMVLLCEFVRTSVSADAAGLVATFPTMLMVTIFLGCGSEGPRFAERVVRGLPFANLSTLAFLVTLRSLVGILPLPAAWGVAVGAAFVTLAIASVLSADVRYSLGQDRFEVDNHLVAGMLLNAVQGDSQRQMNSYEGRLLDATEVGGVISSAELTQIMSGDTDFRPCGQPSLCQATNL